jgi:thioredoxin 1
MKKSITLRGLAVVGIFIICSSFGKFEPPPCAQIDPPAGILFYDGCWEDALATAKKENKLIFIDAFTSWCGPCRLLKANTFTNKQVGDYFNAHFICVAVNTEKGEGVDIAQKYQITHFPTMIIADSNGNRITFTVGYIQPGDLMNFGRYGVQKALQLRLFP